MATFTYDDTNLDNSPKDQVRFLLGDRNIHSENARDLLVSDEEIYHALNEYGNKVIHATIYLADMLAAHFARDTTVRTSRVTTEKAALQRHFRELANRLRRQTTTNKSFIVLGRYKSTADRLSADTSLKQGHFAIGMHGENFSDSEIADK